MRRTRDGEVVCRCGAYEFPHRLTGGMCEGRPIVEDYFFGSDCRECHYLDDQDGRRVCQVIEGGDNVPQCPVWRETISRDEVRLYGARWWREREIDYKLR